MNKNKAKFVIEKEHWQSTTFFASAGNFKPDEHYNKSQHNEECFPILDLDQKIFNVTPSEFLKGDHSSIL